MQNRVEESNEPLWPPAISTTVPAMLSDPGTEGPAHDGDHEWLEACICEGHRLQIANPSSHDLRNDLGALQMLRDLMREGLPLNRQNALNCLARMRNNGVIVRRDTT